MTNINTYNLKTIDNAYGNRAILSDGRYCYIGTRGGHLLKYDFMNVNEDITNEPVTLWDVVLNSKNTITGIDAKGKYLIVCDRDITSWDGIAQYTEIGHLYVVDSTDGNIISTTLLNNKGCGVHVYKDKYVIVSLQIYGWAIYDISDLSSPILKKEITNQNLWNKNKAFYKGLGEVSYKNIGEYQRIVIFSQDGVDWVVFSGFGTGVFFWDITNIDDLESDTLYSHRFDLKRKNIAEYETTAEQIFDIVYDNGFIYGTIAPTIKNAAYDITRRRGIFRIDLSDWESIDNNVFEYFPLPIDEWSLYYGEGDLQPNMLCIVGDCIVTNNGQRGIVIYSKSDTSCEFYKSIETGKDGIVRPISATKTGKCYFAMDNSSGGDRVVGVFSIPKYLF